MDVNIASPTSRHSLHCFHMKTIISAYVDVSNINCSLSSLKTWFQSLHLSVNAKLVSASTTVVLHTIGPILLHWRENTILFHVFSNNVAHFWTPALGTEPARWMVYVALLLYEPE